MRAGTHHPSTGRPGPRDTGRPGPRDTGRPDLPDIRATSRPGAPAHRVPPRRRALLAGLALVTGSVLTAGCGADPGPTPAVATTSTGTPARPPEARDRLAALAAAAQDRHLSARYILSVPDRPDRTVTVTGATDGTWRVDIPGGALDGAADISVARTPAGLFQCVLPSTSRPEPAGCVRAGDPDQPLPAEFDPRVQHPFLDWPGVLTDRRAPLSVAASPPLPGVRGDCFAVESTSASISPALDVGVYCYDPDGTLTGARLAYGTLVLAGAPVAGPATVGLPGPVVDGTPLPVGGTAGDPPR